MSTKPITRREFTRRTALGTGALLAPGLLKASANPANAAPNVILIITDDQGYGDLGAHGNPIIRTPNMDALWSHSVRFTQFHVDPTCAPTRASLLTGRYSTRTGVWHTVMGRSLMDPREVTLAEMFRANGYRTGLFGKWHLGDNYPCRPQDFGFDSVVMHGGGGVGQTPDWWENDYFDDTYWRDGIPEAFEGYCTDVWFEESIRFIERNRERPFFCYISTNAPHDPLYVAPEYFQPYLEQGVPENMAKFYGMIENIDENLGRLRRRLKELELADNTILIFMTDNGTAYGVDPNAGEDQWGGYNADMRGRKGSMYDGGHRVPFFVHWPAGGLSDGRDVNQLAAHIDVLPTLADLCGLDRPDGPPIDGIALRPLLYGDEAAWRDRTLFVHSQRIPIPEKWRQTAVMTERWRLVNGNQLYDVQDDLGQARNLAEEHPAVMEELSAAYDEWWESLAPVFTERVYIELGADVENPARLTAHDWLVDDTSQCPWNQIHIRQGLIANGPWAVRITRGGRYRFDLYRWPRHLDKPMNCHRAKLRVGEIEVEQEIGLDATHARFEVELEASATLLHTWLIHAEGNEHGAYFVWVERL